MFFYTNILLLFCDIYLRTKIINNKNYKLSKLSITFNTTYNKNLVFGLHKNSKYQFIILFFSLFGISYLYLLQNNEYFLIIILSGTLNICEKIIKGYIVDYITIRLSSIKTYNFNIADLLICTNYILYILKENDYNNMLWLK